MVQPRQLPDGLLEVRLAGESEDDLFLLEVATRPERRVAEQLTRDLMLVYLDRGELAGAVTLVLRPEGKYRIPGGRNLRDRRGLSACRLQWRVVELWTVPAEELLSAGDVGLIPWVPLTDYRDPPETIIRRCRDTIEQRAPPDEMANLMAVTQVFTELRYRKHGLLGALLSILGGRKIMLESPLIQEIVKDAMVDSPLIEEIVVGRVCARAQNDVLAALESRFGELPPALAEEIRSVTDDGRLTDLIRKAASAPDLDTFRKELSNQPPAK